MGADNFDKRIIRKQCGTKFPQKQCAEGEWLSRDNAYRQPTTSKEQDAGEKEKS